jgi:hypothetical protein
MSDLTSTFFPLPAPCAGRGSSRAAKLPAKIGFVRLGWSLALPVPDVLNGLLAVFLLPAVSSLAADTGTKPLSFPAAPISLRETVNPSPLVDWRKGKALVAGRVRDAGRTNVTVRVTTGTGASFQAIVPAARGQFRCEYPSAFAGAPPLEVGALFIDATTDSDFEVARPGHFQAEATLLVHGGAEVRPDLPSAFTCDLRDQVGRVDQRSCEWPTVRALVNLYMRSQAARTVGVGRAAFDLAKPEDLRWFKENLSLYEFDQRDRDWSQPLRHRLRRTFWQSVWNTWFNASNDHPLDGNPANHSTTNYLPYAFANDLADLLVMYWMRQGCHRPLDDNLLGLVREGTENLLAMQHRDPSNFALPDAKGHRENYTAGAFRYGLFENGDFMVEGKGWFYNPRFRDYAGGGVLNGRAVWALGEALRHDPHGLLAPQLKGSITLALRFCLQDGRAGGYTKETRQGRVYWRDAGEHAYLLLGMLAACAAAPDLQVPVAGAGRGVALRELCAQSLTALVDLETPAHQWSIYPNEDAVAVAALAEGAVLLAGDPAAGRWGETAIRVADAWMAARVDPQERALPAVQFGLRVAPERMTYIWQKGGMVRLFLYQDGHWIHALADLHALTGSPRFRVRAEAMAAYLCGDNPWQARLFNELGGVYNWTDDTNGDGIEDLLKQDMYPESTAFCQIGLMRLMESEK